MIKINIKKIICLMLITIFLISTNAFALKSVENNEIETLSSGPDDLDPLVDLKVTVTIKEIRAFDKIDIISGFFENRFKTFFNPFPTGDFSSLYNSRTVIAIVTLTIEMKDEDSTAKCSPYSVGKANIIKGIPK